MHKTSHRPWLRDDSPDLSSQSSFLFAVALDSQEARSAAVCRHLPKRGGEESPIRNMCWGQKGAGALGLASACSTVTGPLYHPDKLEGDQHAKTSMAWHKCPPATGSCLLLK